MGKILTDGNRDTKAKTGTEGYEQRNKENKIPPKKVLSHARVGR